MNNKRSRILITLIIFMLIIGSVISNGTISSAGAGGTLTLQTTYAAGNNHRGNMFDIEVIGSSPVFVDSFMVSPMGSTDIQIYYKIGSYVDATNNSSAWTNLGVGQVTFDGTPKQVDINGVWLFPGETYGFYITSINQSVSLNYSNGFLGENYSDANIKLIPGCGLEYPFTNGTLEIFTPRTFNGAINYSVDNSPKLLSEIPIESDYTGSDLTDFFISQYVLPDISGLTVDFEFLKAGDVVPEVSSIGTYDVRVTYLLGSYSWEQIITGGAIVNMSNQPSLSISTSNYFIDLLDEPVQLTTNGGAGTGELIWSGSNDEVATVSNTGIVTPVAVGSFDVNVTKSSDDNYKDITSDSITINIVDKAQLRALVEDANDEIDESVVGEGNGQYLKVEVDKLQTAIDEAETSLLSPLLSQLEIEVAINTLQSAIDDFLNTKNVVDSSSLNELIDTTMDILNSVSFGLEKGDHYPDSKTRLETAIKAAKQVMLNGSYTATDISNAIMELQKEINIFNKSIVEVNYSKIKDLIESYKEIVNAAPIGGEIGQYPKESVDALNLAIEAAIKILSNQNVTQEEIDLVIEELNEAYEIFKKSKIITKSLVENTTTVKDTIATDVLKSKPDTGDNKPIILSVLIIVLCMGSIIVIKEIKNDSRN